MTSESEHGRSDSSWGVIYKLEDRPPLGQAIVLGLQHVLTMFGSTVAVPLLFGPLLWPVPEGLAPELTQRLTSLQYANTALLVSSVMLCSGIATLLQTTLGSRLPIIQGISFSFIAAFKDIIATSHGSHPVDWSPLLGPGPVSVGVRERAVDAWQQSGAVAMQAIAGAILLGAIIETLIGFSGLVGRLRHWLSPVVVGPVIMLIGLALYQIGAISAASHWPTAILTMALIVTFAFVLSHSIRFFRLFPMISAIVVSVTLCYVLSQVGIYQPGDAAFVRADTIAATPWLRSPASVWLPWGWPTFGVGAFVAVLAGYMASIIESFGDYHACKHAAGAGDPTAAEISRGIGMEGVGCAVTGLFGGFSSTSYSENIGLVGLTKVASRYVVQLAGVMLILLGFVEKFGAVAASIPKPVVGGLYCTMFGLVAAVGVRQFAKADLTNDRNLFVGGFALFMGLSLPFYFAYGTGRADLEWLSPGIRNVAIALFSTGMAVAAVLGILLDNLLPGRDRAASQATDTPGILVPEGADIDADAIPTPPPEPEPRFSRHRER